MCGRDVDTGTCSSSERENITTALSPLYRTLTFIYINRQKTTVILRETRACVCPKFQSDLTKGSVTAFSEAVVALVTSQG